MHDTLSDRDTFKFWNIFFSGLYLLVCRTSRFRSVRVLNDWLIRIRTGIVLQPRQHKFAGRGYDPICALDRRAGRIYHAGRLGQPAEPGDQPSILPESVLVKSLVDSKANEISAANVMASQIDAVNQRILPAMLSFC